VSKDFIKLTNGKLNRGHPGCCRRPFNTAVLLNGSNRPGGVNRLSLSTATLTEIQSLHDDISSRFTEAISVAGPR
jgi:hypothetical protein